MHGMQKVRGSNPLSSTQTNTDWIDESASWQDIHHCNFSAGLAVIDGMLFVATTENRLWRMDLHGLRQP
jgi:hypothetical protein